MPKFDDALRGYAHAVHIRDGFRCRYCGLDGTKNFENWLHLSWDHLLPKGHPNRDDEKFIVTSCLFCNTADNQFFAQAKKRGLQFEAMSSEELIAQRLPYVMATRKKYNEFWDKEVKKCI
jgi:hypothetical protein